MGTRIFAAFLNLESDPLSLPKLLLQSSQKAALAITLMVKKPPVK